MKIGVIGGSGFIGSEICRQFESKINKVINITESGTDKKYFDILINANGNPYKYLAEQNPVRDFDMAVRTVYESIINYNFNLYVYVSSIDVESPITCYGCNRLIAEEIVRVYCQDYLIIRLCSIIGPGMKKGVVKDILEGSPSRLTVDSQLYLMTVDEVARKLINIVTDNQIRNQAVRFYSKAPIDVYNIYKTIDKDCNISENAKYEHYFFPGSHLGFLTSQEYLKQIL